MYDGLRGFIELLEKRKELLRINDADPDLEIGALTVLAGQMGENHPAVLFDRIKGYSEGYRILTNLITTKARSKIGAGIDPNTEMKDEVDYVVKMLDSYSPIHPREVSSGPVMENKEEGDGVNLLKFPAPKWHELDGGKYLGTGSLVFTRDPDEGWVNAGIYRLQLFDKNTVGVAVNPGHHGGIIAEKYWLRGKNCPVVISLGHDPRLLEGAHLGVPWGESELDYAGWFLKKPVDVIIGKYTGLPMPNNSEVILEGEIPPPSIESRMEGPFGEFGGYYSMEPKPQPVMKVKAVYYRNNPIIDGRPPFRGLSHDGMLPFTEAILMQSLRKIGLNDVKKVGRMGPFMVVSMTPRYPGHSRRVADFVMTGIATRPPKYVLVVDEDIDPSNQRDVLWALSSRVDAAESVYLVKNRWGSPTDPRIPPEKKKVGDITASSLIFDATMPITWKDEFPKPTAFSKSVLDAYREKWVSKLGQKTK